MVLATACATLTGFDRPDVTLVDLEIENVAKFETEAWVTLRVINANKNQMTVTGSSITVFLDGRKIGRSVANQRLQVEGLSSETLEAPLYISNIALGRRIYALLTEKQRRLDYRIKGKLTLGGGFGGRRVRVEHQGEFELPERRRRSDDLSEDFSPDPSS